MLGLLHRLRALVAHVVYEPVAGLGKALRRGVLVTDEGESPQTRDESRGDR